MGAIFLTIVLDLLGFGLVLPFLAEEARDAFGASPFVATLLSAVYSLMQFVFAPLWGRLSDRIGRKPVLVWSVAATAASNLGLGLALAYGDGIGWLFAARIAAGIATANLAVASAYIADITSAEDRAKGMGLIGMAFGIGFILGPGVGGVLAAHPVGGRHGPLACFAAAALSVVNVGWVVFGLRESLSREHRGENRSRRAIDPGALRRVASDPMLVRVIAVNFVLILSFANLDQTFRFFNKDAFAMSVSETGLVLAFIGVVAASVQGGLVRVIGPKVDEAVLVRMGALIQVLAFALIAASPGFGKWMLYVGGGTLAIGNGLSQPGISAYVSNRAGKHEQGSVLGVSQSAASLGRVFGPAMGGFLYGRLGMQSPYLAGALGMGVATVIAMTLAPARIQRTSTQTS
jgi:MFS family permease